jgi:hypothetical protein
MGFFKRFIFLTIIFLASSSFSPRMTDYRKAMFNNVCKDFKHDVLLYYVFIDNKTTSPWTEFDIQSTTDSINVAVKWLLEQARKNNIPLRITTDFYAGTDYPTITKSLPQGSVIKSLTVPNIEMGIENINEWSEAIAKKIGSTIEVSQKEGHPESKPIQTKERLIAYLRNTFQVESVALIFLVNNYYQSDISIYINTFNTNDIEFAVVSYKYPSEIAHNILHLYGAADMYKTPYRQNERKIAQLKSLYPNDIMQDPYGRNISTLEIGDYTQYLIGWKSTCNKTLEPLFTDKIAGL